MVWKHRGRWNEVMENGGFQQLRPEGLSEAARHKIMPHSRDDVVAVVQKTFPESAHNRVLELLDTYGVESYERERERVQLAILKLSEGNEEKLREFVAIAKRDYRDVLFWAEYPEEAKLDTPQKRERFRKMCEQFGIEPPQNL